MTVLLRKFQALVISYRGRCHGVAGPHTEQDGWRANGQPAVREPPKVMILAACVIGFARYGWSRGGGGGVPKFVCFLLFHCWFRLYGLGTLMKETKTSSGCGQRTRGKKPPVAQFESPEATWGRRSVS